MHEADKLAASTSISCAQDSPITSPPRAVATAEPTGISPYEVFSGSSTTGLSALHTTPAGAAGLPALHAALFPAPGLPPLPPPPPPPVPGSLYLGGVGGAGGGGGSQVVVHWKQGGPCVQPGVTDRTGHLSADDEEEGEDDDEELLTPPPPRERLSYTRYQLELLNGIFDAVRYPNSVQKQLIAKRVGISREQVKIWFQNRRRKDVVTSKTTSPGDGTKSGGTTQDSSSPSSNSTPTPKTEEDGGTDGAREGGGVLGQEADDSSEGQGETGSSSKCRMVPDAVINGCISELHRFSDDKLKERKEKRKARGKRRNAAAARAPNAVLHGLPPTHNQPVGSLFQAYDMIAPPNKITPTAAHLDTSANRFTHSHNSSAFSHPRDHLATVSRLAAWEGLNSGLNSSIPRDITASQLAHSRGYGGLGISGLGLGLLPSSSAPTASARLSGPDSLPALSDLLSYRQQQQAESDRSSQHAEALLTHSPLLPPSTATSREAGSSVHSSPVSVPAFGVGGVYPFPLTAQAPIVLSSLHQHPFPHHPHHWPFPPPSPIPPPVIPNPFSPIAAINRVDPYKPVYISSFTNPYFTPNPPSLPHWPSSEPRSDQNPGSSYPQR